MSLQPVGSAPVDGAPAGGGRCHAVLSSLSSDAHTWNLAYLQLVLEELGCRVTNLGACVPDEVIISTCRAERPDLLVISSLNGHGHRDGARLIGALRADPALAGLPAMIGGKLDVVDGSGENVARLLAAGFDAVFEDGGAGLNRFRSLVGTIATRDPQVLGTDPRRTSGARVGVRR